MAAYDTTVCWRFFAIARLPGTATRSSDAAVCRRAHRIAWPLLHRESALRRAARIRDTHSYVAMYVVGIRMHVDARSEYAQQIPAVSKAWLGRSVGRSVGRGHNRLRASSQRDPPEFVVSRAIRARK